jgi:glutamate decarboxylase
MALSTANTNAAESHLHCSTFASRYVRTALPRYILLLIGAPAA